MRDDIKVGDKIVFLRETQGYTVKARTDRYIICTKPMNARKTIMYTIVDLEASVRGLDTFHVLKTYDYSLQSDIDRCLSDLDCGRVAISHKNRVPLDIQKVKKGRQKDERDAV